MDNKIGEDTFSTSITLLLSFLAQQREHSRAAWEVAGPETQARAAYCDGRYQAAIDRLVESYTGLYSAYCWSMEDISSIARAEKLINRDIEEMLTTKMLLMSPAELTGIKE